MKTKLFLLALGVTLGLSSCSSDDLGGTSTAGDEATVTITAQIPSSIASRAYSDGKTATNLYALVYQTDGTTPKYVKTETATFSGLEAKITTRLMKQLPYKIVFWAQNGANAEGTTSAGEAPYTIDTESGVVNMHYDSDNAMGSNENRDAFFGDYTIANVEGDVTVSEPIKLYRPFAQLNFGTTQDDIDAAVANGYPFSKAKVTAETYTSFSLLEGEATGNATSVDFNYADFPGTAEEFPVDGYTYLAMDYLLAKSDKSELKEITLTVASNDENKSETFTYTNVPVQRNYQTNIYGNLFTNEYTIAVQIDPKYSEPAYDNKYNITDATSLKKALKEAVAGSVLVLSTEEGKTEATYDITEDLSATQSVTLEVGEGVTLNLDAEATTANGVKSRSESEGHKIVVSNNATLTLAGKGTIKKTKAGNLIAVEKGATVEFAEGAKLVAADGSKALALAQGASAQFLKGKIKATGEALEFATADDNTFDATEVLTALSNTKGVEVTLGNNKVLTGALGITGTSVLDLNGYTITPDPSNYDQNAYGSSYDAVIVVPHGVTLTVKDSKGTGEIAANDSKIRVAVKLTYAGDGSTDDAKLIVDGAKIRGYSFAVSGNGNRQNTNITVKAGSTLISESETGAAIYHPQYGTVNIEGGTLTGQGTAIELRSGNLNITGGKFTSTLTPSTVSSNNSGTTTIGCAIAVAQHTTKQDINVNISGGEFNGEYAFRQSNPQNNETDNVKLNISGGTFNGKIASVLNDKFISGGAFNDPSALEFVTTDSKAVVTLDSDHVFTTPIAVVGKATLDLNGHEISATELTRKYYTSDGLIVVARGADFTVKDSKGTGKIVADVSKGQYCDIKVTYKDEVNADDVAKLTIDGGNFVGTEYAIAGNGTRHNTEVTINGGTITADNTAIYNPQDGKLTINGGKITGKDSGIEVRSGNLKITGGEIISEATEASISSNGNGTTTKGAALAVAQHQTKLPISVEISGGKFKGIYAFRQSNPENNDTDNVTIVDISGGTFIGIVSAEVGGKFISGGTFSEQPDIEYIKDGANITVSSEAAAKRRARK